MREVTDSILGPNEALINGYVYRPADQRRKGSPFLEGDQWSRAQLFIEGKRYPGQSIRYNLVRDEILLKAITDHDRVKLIEMNKYKLDSFRMKRGVFVNSREFGLRGEEPTFYEVIANREITFVRAYSKQFVDKYDLVTPYGKYSGVNTSRYIIHQGKLHSADSRFSFLRFFDREDRRKIRRFIREQGIRYNKARESELTRLLNFCNDLIQST